VGAILTRRVQVDRPRPLSEHAAAVFKKPEAELHPITLWVENLAWPSNVAIDDEALDPVKVEHVGPGPKRQSILTLRLVILLLVHREPVRADWDLTARASGSDAVLDCG
jgi:hypothetical protein